MDKTLGTNEDDYGRGIAIDNNDSIYITGYTEGDLNGQSNSGGNDAFLIKLAETSSPILITKNDPSTYYDYGSTWSGTTSDDILVWFNGDDGDTLYGESGNDKLIKRRRWG